MTTSSKQTLFLIDGSNNMYRCYYAIRGLSNSSGMATNAVYGFIQMLRKLLKDHKPDAVAVAFDVGGATFRHKQFEDYKKDRRPMPDDLAVQIPFIFEVCEGFGLPVLTDQEVEADDLIGSLACKARDAGYDVVLATSDKDFFQLVGDGIRFYHTGRDAMYDEEGVREAFGLAPSQVVDAMAIWGDAIDNIPGVPGIGEKGAKALIGEFGSLENVYENLDKLKPAQRKKLEENREQAFLSKDLARIRCDLDVEFDPQKLRLSLPDRNRLHDLFSRLEFSSLMQEFLPEAPAAPREYASVSSREQLTDLMRGDSPAAIHFEAGFDDESRIDLVSFSTSPGTSHVVAVSPQAGATKDLTDTIREILSSDRRFVAHDMKVEMRALETAGLPAPKNYDDTMLLSYVLNPGAYGHQIENVCRERLKRDVTLRRDFAKKSQTLTFAQECIEFVGEKTDVVMALYEKLAPEVRGDEALQRIYETVELPLIPVLAEMENRGIRIDVELLRQMSSTMGQQIAELEAKIYKEAGEEFNINSPTQLATILFEKLQYPVLKKTQKTKSFSTGVEVLKELAGYGYAVPQLILEHRELHKLKSTYVDALPQLLDANGRVHTTFNQAVAATGRLSSSDPNLQNIPVRTPMGREIRKAFIADEGFLILAADYSQIELRILAHMSGDQSLIDTFHRGADIHRATAAKIFNVNEALVTPDQRRAAKTINFGVLYGMSAFRLSQDLGISAGEGKEFIQAYFARFPTIREFLDSTLRDARTSGKVTTMFGRVRHIPEINNRSFTIRGNAERMATNAPIQGTAADLLKLAMIALDRRLKKDAAEARMLLTVHDEIVFEIPEQKIEEVGAIVKDVMESIHPLAVPLSVETGWGRTWYDAKE